MDPDFSTSTEAELESFRQKWRAEVSARAKAVKASGVPASPKAAPSSSKPHAPRSRAPDAVSLAHTHQWDPEETDEVAPHIYHDLVEKHHGPKLEESSAQAAATLAASGAPASALEHYERAVEKESQGSLGDSVNLYRKAFRLDSKVHETYKAKHFPPSYFKAQKEKNTLAGTASALVPTRTNEDFSSSEAFTKLPNSANHALHGLSPSLRYLISTFSTLSIQGEPPPTDLSPTPSCPIAALPEEILVEILEHLAVKDIASFVRLAQVCKRLAYLVTTEDRVWKRLAMGREYGFTAMHYSWSCQIDGKPLGHDGTGGLTLSISNINLSDIQDDQFPEEALTQLSLTQLLVPSTYPTYRMLFQRRPRIRFNGCYISTVNYTRPGQSSPTSVTWNSPIHIVTYYRYLRFLRDGTCISLLTTSEPADVVPYLYIEHMHKTHGNLPTAPMKDALLGRWRLTGPDVPGNEDAIEKEGTVIVETAGVTPKYMYKMALNVSSAGRGLRNNKLAWQGYWSYNRLTDDWGEFGLKNDRAFYWSRVKSYGMAWDESGMKVA